MSKCIDCGANFVGTPENPPPEGLRCKWCEIKRLKAELAKAQEEVKFLKSSECEAAWCDRWAKLCEERNELRAELAKANRERDQFFQKLVEIRCALMGFYDPEIETEVLAIRRLTLAKSKARNTALRDLLGPTIRMLSELYAHKWPTMAEVKWELARLRAAMEGK